LRLALVAGPMYDHLYSFFDELGVDVEVVVHADHPTLNREVATRLAAGERLDLVSTHGKYAPAQARWLLPLDDLVDPARLAELAPRAVELCRVRERLLCVPRLIDVRVLWTRTDRVADVPDTWAELLAGETVFGFPGRESGLFGTFFELVVGAGGRLFDEAGRACIDSPEAVDAVEVLRRLAQRAGPELPTWHYDDVDAALLDGRVDAAAAWPGAWGAIRRSAVADRLAPHPYLAGAARRVSYSGCHAWAIPATTADRDGAVDLLHALVGREAQALDAAGGNVCAHLDAFAGVRPVDDVDRRRLEITRRTIEESMITYPSAERFPEIEDAGWSSLREALQGELPAHEAVARVQRVAQRVLAGTTAREGDPA